jgi:hypothetical protein
MPGYSHACVDPLELSILPEIGDETLIMELTHVTRLESEESNFKGEWEPHSENQSCRNEGRGVEIAEGCAQVDGVQGYPDLGV